MIISHSKQFILVKSRKTASTSVQQAIVKSLGRGDIWTPTTIPPLPGQNYYSFWPVDYLTANSKTFRRWVGRESALHYRYYYDHIPLSKVKTWLSATTFQGYRKYAFDRNPWDYVVSYYSYRRRKGEVEKWDFDRFLYEYPIIQNWSLYTENDAVIANRVFRYEEIDAALKTISDESGLLISDVPRYKQNYRNNSDYRSYYSQSSRDFVARRWSNVISYLHYDF